jgi:alpha-galactosidase
MNRRELFRVSTGALVALSGAQAAPATLDLATVKRAPGRVVPMDPNAAGVELRRDWKDGFCTSRVINRADHGIRIREVVLFSFPHNLPPETRLYGESFQMLSQTSGTLGQPVDLGYSEVKHYRIPQPAGVTAVTGLLTLSPPGQDSLLFAFTSCNRYIGRFYVRAQAIDAVLDTEGRELAPGETWDLEEFQFAAGLSRAALLSQLATRINRHHPPLRWTSPPTGWCSWYCFGPRVTATQVLENLDVIAKNVPALKYV